MSRSLRIFAAILLAFVALSASALEKQPSSVYHARRAALGNALKGGVAIFFAAEEPSMEYLDYRQDEDFFYLTGWNEPGAALLIIGDASMANPQRSYREILFLPTRNRIQERYTGVKLDAATPGAAASAGVDAVEAMTELPAELNRLIESDRRLTRNLWAEPDSKPAQALATFTASTLGMDAAPSLRDVSELTAELRILKDAGEIALLRKASDASIAAQKTMMRAARPGVTERAIAGRMTAVWLENGCERASYPPIVGAGVNSTVLHYSENSATLQDGDLLLVDAACEYSMYASDITRTIPVNGHFTDRQREIYNIVYQAQKAAIEAFVVNKSKINDRDRRDPDSLENAAYNYINTHGKDLHGEPLGKYWLHGMGHMVGIDVHDPGVYPQVLKPGMVFTIEPGVYIPEEKIGVRLECVFVVGQDGKLIDLTADLPHTAEEIEAFIAAPPAVGQTPSAGPR